ncbi:hypothetical protein VTI74DRAFT_5511 [Chaetomium olivicolor]
MPSSLKVPSPSGVILTMRPVMLILCGLCRAVFASGFCFRLQLGLAASQFSLTASVGWPGSFRSVDCSSLALSMGYVQDHAVATLHCHPMALSRQGSSQPFPAATLKQVPVNYIPPSKTAESKTVLHCIGRTAQLVAADRWRQNIRPIHTGQFRTRPHSEQAIVCFRGSSPSCTLTSAVVNGSRW